MDDTIKKQLTEVGVDLDKTMERFMNNEAVLYGDSVNLCHEVLF